MGNLVQILTARRLQLGRPHPLRAGRRRDRHDRRPQGVGGAHAQHPGRGQGLGRARARPDRAVPVVRGRQRRDDGEQLRLDRERLGHRLPARHRQALPGQPHARPRRRQPAPRGGHQLHRVQLRPAPVDGLPQPPPRLRRHAAVRRQRPVGQHHRRRGADPARRRRPRRTPSPRRWSRRPTARSTARPRAARSGSTRRCCRPTPSTSSGSTSRTRRSASCSASSRSSRARRSRRSSSRPPRSRSCAPAQKALADEVTTLVHGAEETERAKAAAAALFAGGDLTALDPGTLASALREAGSAQVRRDDGLPTIVDLLVETGLCKSKGDARRDRVRGRRLRQQRAGRRRRVAARPSRTCWPAAGWCSGAARSTSPGSRSSSAGGPVRGRPGAARSQDPVRTGPPLLPAGCPRRRLGRRGRVRLGHLPVPAAGAARRHRGRRRRRPCSAPRCAPRSAIAPTTLHRAAHPDGELATAARRGRGRRPDGALQQRGHDLRGDRRRPASTGGCSSTSPPTGLPARRCSSVPSPPAPRRSCSRRTPRWSAPSTTTARRSGTSSTPAGCG